MQSTGVRFAAIALNHGQLYMTIVNKSPALRAGPSLPARRAAAPASPIACSALAVKGKQRFGLIRTSGSPRTLEDLDDGVSVAAVRADKRYCSAYKKVVADRHYSSK
jgi:hypothetical protein